MILHVCSHFGDIEIKPGKDGRTLIHYAHLTPKERQVLTDFLAKHDYHLGPHTEGSVALPLSLWEVGAALGEGLCADTGILSAVRFESGKIQVAKGTILDWFKKVIGLGHTDTPVAELPKEIKPEAAVQVTEPKRGCPMPTTTELKELKAAAVVRKFLVGQQVEDFDRRRSFLAIGGDTGGLYRITTRWNPDVERFGVLYSVGQRARICASNLKVPPSEEALSMKFAIENFEQQFLNRGLAGYGNE